MRAADHAAALDYLQTGIAALGESQWHDNEELAFSLHLTAADTARYAADYDGMHRFVEVIAASATDPAHLVEARLRSILYLSHIGDHAAAIAEATTALAESGWTVPDRPRRRHVARQRMTTRLHLARIPALAIRIRAAGMTKADFNEMDLIRITPRGSRTGGNALAPSDTAWIPNVLVFGPERQAPPIEAVEDRTSYHASTSIYRILELPATSDDKARRHMQLISEALVSAYWTDPNMLTLLTLRGVDLSLTLGVDQSTPLCFAFYGALVSNRERNPEEGLGYADIALQMARNLGSLSKPSRVRLVRDEIGRAHV